MDGVETASVAVTILFEVPLTGGDGEQVER